MISTLKDLDGEKGRLPRHLHSLDALRGIAALAVVFWHWQHFFSRTAATAPFEPERQPFYLVFKLFYTEGWQAVDLFFCLSGFIFFWLYAEKISGHKTSLREFFFLRFSRLYPLHAVTLLAVAAGQQIMLRQFGAYFIYPNNDFFHFALQTIFASNWGFERGPSFNAPIWSVSIEVLLYAIFFVVCLLNIRRWWHLALFILCGLLSTTLHHDFLLGRGIVSFFAGGISFYIFAGLVRRRLPRFFLRSLGACTGLLWVLVPLNGQYDLLYGIYRLHFWSKSLDWHGKDVGGAILLRLSGNSAELLLFPLTLLTLALCETKRGALTKHLAFLGQISYSSYLLHFPLQMVFAGAAMAFAISSTFFYTPLALVLFFAILIPLSLLSYHFLELPCQSRIRAWAFRASPIAQNLLGQNQKTDDGPASEQRPPRPETVAPLPPGALP